MGFTNVCAVHFTNASHLQILQRSCIQPEYLGGFGRCGREQLPKWETGTAGLTEVNGQSTAAPQKYNCVAALYTLRREVLR